MAAIIGVLLSSGVGRAEKLMEPQVEYSAWSVIETQMGGTHPKWGRSITPRQRKGRN